MKPVRRTLLGGVIALPFYAAAAAQTPDEFAGEWYGALDYGSQQLRLRLVIEAGPSAVLYSIDQGNAPIPVAETVIEGPALRIEMPVIQARFVGVLGDGVISGEFTQGGGLPLSFARQPVAASVVSPLTERRLAALRAGAGSPALAAAAANRDGRKIGFANGVRALGSVEAVTTNDRWHLGSITKSMTATLVARCVEAGAISWDDSVSACLGAAMPEMRAEYRHVTFRHLLSHRSGLPANLDLSELLRFPRASADARADRIAYARLALAQAPAGPLAAHFEYSNSGYVVAGAMLEARLGLPWEDLIGDRVFTQLGMSSAGFGAPGTPNLLDEPAGHAPSPNGALEPFAPGIAPITDNVAALGPAGRVHARLDDLLVFLAAHRDRRGDFLQRASWDRLHTPPFGGSYALGWVKRESGLWHNGSNTLWYAEVLVDFAEGVAAAAAANDGRADALARPIGSLLLEAASAVS